MNTEFGVLGSGFYSSAWDSVTVMDQWLICVNDKGVIEDIYTKESDGYDQAIESCKQSGTLKVLGEDEILLPGFVDLHIHGPQWAQSGTALDQPLEVWLGEYTFPLEEKFKDLDFAKEVYEDVVETTLRNGTTTAVYFAAVNVESSVLLAKICGDKGQRAYVGKVAMDAAEGCPDYYKDEDAKASIELTERFIRQVQGIQKDYRQQVAPVVTPRFIPTCTDESLKGLGMLAASYDLMIQTHASESDWAHGYVKERMGVNDAVALESFGLMTKNTLVAHAPFLEEEDQQLLAETGSTVVHCPLSNAYFANSVLPVNEFMNKGINIGLATDISGGYSPSMYQAIRQSVVSSKMLEDGVDPSIEKDKRGRKASAITLNNALYMATVAGGKAVSQPIGKFEKGHFFDAQVVNTRQNIPRFGAEKRPEDLLHKVLLLAQTENIKEIWVQGELRK